MQPRRSPGLRTCPWVQGQIWHFPHARKEQTPKFWVRIHRFLLFDRCVEFLWQDVWNLYWRTKKSKTHCSCTCWCTVCHRYQKSFETLWFGCVIQLGLVYYLTLCPGGNAVFYSPICHLLRPQFAMCKYQLFLCLHHLACLAFFAHSRLLLACKEMFCPFPDVRSYLQQRAVLRSMGAVIRQESHVSSGVLRSIWSFFG